MRGVCGNCARRRAPWREGWKPLKRFRGKHYRLEEAMNHPPVLSRSHPPIMVGGMGEKKTLRLVAQYADACNLFAYGGAETIRHKLEVLKRHCEEVGRDYEEIERTALGTINPP